MRVKRNGPHRVRRAVFGGSGMRQDGRKQALKGKLTKKRITRKRGGFRAQEKPLEKQFANRQKESPPGRAGGVCGGLMLE